MTIIPFKIDDHVTFNSRNRAACPACITQGKKETNQNLSLLESGARISSVVQPRWHL